MKSMNRFHYPMGMASSLVMVACGALAQETETYTPLGLENRPPLKTIWQADTKGIAQLGLSYTSDDNYMFGEYNGLRDTPCLGPVVRVCRGALRQRGPDDSPSDRGTRRTREGE